MFNEDKDLRCEGTLDPGNNVRGQVAMVIMAENSPRSPSGNGRALVGGVVLWHQVSPATSGATTRDITSVHRLSI